MKNLEAQLSRRERQIMDALYVGEGLSSAELAERLPNPPTPTAVRTMLRTLMDKGLVQRRKRGREYLYWPATARRRAGRSAMQRVVDTFFNGSLDHALAAYINDGRKNLSDEDLKRLTRVIREARSRGE